MLNESLANIAHRIGMATKGLRYPLVAPRISINIKSIFMKVSAKIINC
jgi:hypothetical protein